MKFMSALLFLLSFSCANDMNEVEKITESESYPDIEGEDIQMYYTDSAETIISMRAAEVINYSSVEEPYTEFPKGIHVVYFSSYPDTASMIRADYAIKYEDKHMWEAKGNVVTKNVEGEKLETEFLIWDEFKEKIYTNEQVTISTGTDVIWGHGFEADQDFTNWSIKKISGEISLKNEFDKADTTPKQ